MNEFTAEDMTVLLEAFAYLMDSDFATGFAEYLDLSDEYLNGLRVKVDDALAEYVLNAPPTEYSIFNDEPWMIPVGDEQEEE